MIGRETFDDIGHLAAIGAQDFVTEIGRAPAAVLARPRSGRGRQGARAIDRGASPLRQPHGGIARIVPQREDIADGQRRIAAHDCPGPVERAGVGAISGARLHLAQRASAAASQRKTVPEQQGVALCLGRAASKQAATRHAQQQRPERPLDSARGVPRRSCRMIPHMRSPWPDGYRRRSTPDKRDPAL